MTAGPWSGLPFLSMQPVLPVAGTNTRPSRATDYVGSVHNPAAFRRGSTMPTVRLRVTGNEYAVSDLMHALEAIDGIERIEEVADLMPHMDDDDSSSAGLPDDESPGLHDIEIEAPNEEAVRRIHRVVEVIAEQTESVIEIVDEF